MNSHERILSLLGLSLRGGNLAVGEEPVDAAARAKDARLLLLAADSADNTRRRCEHMALAGNCLWVRLPCTKEQMGRALGRTSVALAAVTDTGLASALAKLLEEQDPVQYGDTAARMAEKARRADVVIDTSGSIRYTRDSIPPLLAEERRLAALQRSNHGTDHPCAPQAR